MIELKSTLDGTTNTKEIDPTKSYIVDFSKLQKPEDLVLVLSGLGIAFPGNHPIIPHIKQFLNLENPIDLPQQPKNDLEDRIFKGE